MNRRITAAIVTVAALFGLAGLTAAPANAAPTQPSSSTVTFCSTVKTVPPASGQVYACVVWLVSVNAQGRQVAHPNTCSIHNNTLSTLHLWELDYGVSGHAPNARIFYNPSLSVPFGTTTIACWQQFGSWGYYPSPALYVNAELSANVDGPYTWFSVYDV